MPCQVVWSFYEAGQGWSEVYQISSSDPSSYIQVSTTGELTAGCPADVFRAARVLLLNTASSIVHVRCSLIGSPGVTLSAGIGGFAAVGLYGRTTVPPATGSMETFIRALVRIQCGTTRRRTLWLGGVPEDVVTSPQTYSPKPSWNTALAAFRGALIDGGTTYGIAGRPTRLTPPAATAIQTFVTTFTGFSATVGVTNSSAFASTGPVYAIVRGLRFPRGWNGVHLAQATDATHVEIGPLRLPGHIIPAQQPGDRGTIQVFAPAFNKYTNLVVERLTIRKIGLPFGESRGRGPVR